MSKEEVVRFNLKAVINKEKTRVLFAEVGNDFVDLLFSFLILPLGNVLQVLQKHYGDKKPLVIGSLNTLFNGLVKLGRHNYFQSDSYDPVILNSAYAFPHLSPKFQYSPYHQTVFNLGKAYFVVYNVFTNYKASFVICDDLRLVPNVKGSIVETLNNVGLDMVDMVGSTTENVTFGLDEVMDFLMGLLISRQPLTHIVLSTLAKSQLQRCKSGFPLPQIQTAEATDNPKKMILKAMFQKSTKKFLFAQVEEDFVSFLFGVLKIPLGMVDLHLGGSTTLNNLANLYRSLADQVDHKILRTGRNSKDNLMKPETFSSYNIRESVDNILITYTSRIYMVTDDLTVTLMYVTSVLSFLDQMKISSSDVEETEFHIGLEEVYLF